MVALLTVTLAAAGVAFSSSTAAAVDCSQWYSPVGDEIVDPIEFATSVSSDSVRRAPDGSSSCERGVILPAGTAVEVRGEYGDFVYTRNPANNDYGWVTRAALGLGGAIDCGSWYSPVGNEASSTGTATASRDVEVRRAPDHSSACERNVTLRSGTTVEVRGERGDFTYTRNPANNDYGWVESNALSTGTTGGSGGSNGVGTFEMKFRGTTGTERVVVHVGGAVTPTREFTASTVETLVSVNFPLRTQSITSIEIEFINDGLHNGRNRNVNIDWIKVDGVQIQTEDPRVFSTGTWTRDSRCGDDYKQSEWLHCNGSLTYPIEGVANLGDGRHVVSVRLRGKTGAEIVTQRIDLRDPVELHLSGSSETITTYLAVGADLPQRVEITFTNDKRINGISRDVYVDWIEVNGTRIQTEDHRVFSTGTFTRGEGCSMGYKQSEWLHCNGTFTFELSVFDIAGGGTGTGGGTIGLPTSAAGNLAMLQATSARNANHDNSRYRNTGSSSLPTGQGDLVVSWRDYEAAGEVNLANTVSDGFRVACEFSHFAYDDPIIFPNQPAVSHLHMFFGNTDANAFSTADSLLNSGSSTCNGQELNRTSYWVPAFIDPSGNVPIPDEALFYYKAYGPAVGSTEVYPDGMRFVSGSPMATSQQSDYPRELFYRCFGPNGVKGPPSATIPSCASNQQLEMNVRFQTCWNGRDPADFRNNASFSNVWPTSGECPATHPRNLPQLEYRIFFSDHSGSANWILSSDVDMTDRTTINSNGYSLHGDWFGGWNQTINQRWINECVNRSGQDCDEGLLADPRRNGSALALRLRPEYSGPSRQSGATILNDLCPREDAFTGPSSVALCG